MKNYFDFKFKYRLLNKFSDIWNIKTGEIFEIKYSNETKCYRVHETFSWFYNFLIHSLFLPIGVFIFVVINLDFLDNFWLSSLIATIIYLLIEILLIAFIPIVKVSCIEKKIAEKNMLDSNRK